MDYIELIRQLQSLKDNSESFLDKKEPDSIWAADIAALDEAMDIINDYGQVTAQAARLEAKYETAKEVIRRGMGMYQCPDCMKLVNFGNEHCHWCGRRLGWGQKPKKRGKEKCGKR